MRFPLPMAASSLRALRAPFRGWFSTTGAEPNGKPQHRSNRFRAHLAAEELSALIAQQSGPKRLLDIGGALGVHARYFRERHDNVQVDLLEPGRSAAEDAISHDFERFTPAAPYDFIWASHVLEHARNPGSFLDKIHRSLAEGGWLAVTVPPLKHEITFAHKTLWKAGLLLVHLVDAGFDCRDARVATYGYNISVLARKTNAPVKAQREAMPAVAFRGIYFEGRIRRLNWQTDQVSLLQIPPTSPEQMLRQLRETGSPSGFVQSRRFGRTQLHYFEASKAELLAVG